MNQTMNANFPPSQVRSAITEAHRQAWRSPFPFDPERLFGDGVEGLYQNYNDSSTLYQESTGNTAASAVTDPLGLVLDKSQGLVLGSELVTGDNSTFDSVGDWTAEDCTLAVASNEMTVTYAAVTQKVRLPSLVTSGNWYEMTARVKSSTAAGKTVQFAATEAGGGPTVTLTSSYQTISSIVRAGTTSAVFFTQLGVGEDFVIEAGVSVKALPGNHAEQSTSGSRLAYGIQPKEGVRNLLTNSDTMSTQNVETSAVQYTLSIKGTGSVTLSGTSTDGPLNGTGASDIVSLTFTPTAGTLTLTVSGTVTEAQLEKGSSRSTYQSVGAWYNVQQGTVTADNHVYFGASDGIDDFLTIPGSDSVMKFLHDGTGAFVSACVQFGNEDDPDAAYALISTSNGNTSTGMTLFYDDRSAVPRDDVLALTCSDGASNVLAPLTSDGAVPPNQPLVVSCAIDDDAANDGEGFLNNASIFTGNKTGALSSANAATDVHILMRESGFFPAKAKLFSLIILDYIPSDAQKLQIAQFQAQQAGITL